MTHLLSDVFTHHARAFDGGVDEIVVIEFDLIGGHHIRGGHINDGVILCSKAFIAAVELTGGLLAIGKFWGIVWDSIIAHQCDLMAIPRYALDELDHDARAAVCSDHFIEQLVAVSAGTSFVEVIGPSIDQNPGPVAFFVKLWDFTGE
jgi:hypothetical protein